MSPVLQYPLVKVNLVGMPCAKARDSNISGPTAQSSERAPKRKKRQQTSGTSWKQIDSNLSHISLPSSVRRLTACTKQAAHNKLFFCHYLPNNNLCASMECKIQSKAPLQRLHIYIYMYNSYIYIYISLYTSNFLRVLFLDPRRETHLVESQPYI